MEEFNMEIAELEFIALFVFHDSGFGSDSSVFDLMTYHRTCNLRCIDDRNIDFSEKERNAADMVFVSMCDD